MVSKRQVGIEKVRIKLKLIETCLVPAVLYNLEAWERILKREIDEIEKR